MALLHSNLLNLLEIGAVRLSDEVDGQPVVPEAA